MPAKNLERPESTFKKGQEVVYPLQGVGQILNIIEKEFKGKKIEYYEIYLEMVDMTVLVPVDKAEELGIRAIVPRKDAEYALEIITKDDMELPSDWKARYQLNLSLLKKGSVIDIATVVRTLYHRSKLKELPILERKLFDNALCLLVDEIAFSFGEPKASIEQLIFSKLEIDPVPSKPLKTKLILADDLSEVEDEGSDE